MGHLYTGTNGSKSLKNAMIHGNIMVHLRLKIMNSKINQYGIKTSTEA